jgi:hypothetical protein
MTTSEHSEFARRAYANEIAIGVDPALARRFFMESGEHVQQDIGEPLTIERAAVSAAFYLGWAAIVVSVPIGFLAMRWWALVIGPGSVATWLLYNGMASRGRQRLKGVTCALVLVMALWLRTPDASPILRWAVCVTGAFFLARLTYASASLFIRALVVRNARAFDLLVDSIFFVR